MNTFAPGEVFLEKYRIEEVLGQGGMGVVVAARHLELDELVAIKFLHATFATQPEQVERFLREGRAAVKIKSEHVARVRDVGKLENGAPYMIMEHLHGSDLGVLLRKDGRFAVPEAIELILQACEALAEAHQAGIVHRDLKPANLFLTERADGSPCVKVLDFGISKLLGTGLGLTATNGMMGSPLYMSPEQLHASKTVDMRADIWALGVMLFELITGDRPFLAETIPQVVMVVSTEPPRKLESLLPDAPPGLSAVLEKCLAKSTSERYENVGALAKALAPFAPPEAQGSIERIMRVISGTSGGRRTRTARTSPNPEASQPITPIETAPTMASTPAPKMESTNLGGSVRTKPPEPVPPRKQRTGLFIAAGGVAIVLAIVVGLLTRRSEPATGHVPTTPSSVAEAKDAAPPQQASASAEPPREVMSVAPSAAPSASASAPTWIVKAPVTKPVQTTKPSASVAKPNCDPPYVVQPDGTKKYKMECL